MEKHCKHICLFCKFKLRCDYYLSKHSSICFSSRLLCFLFCPFRKHCDTWKH